MNRFWLMFGLVGCISIASAQEEKGRIELGAFVGASLGVGQSAVMAGGNISYAATDAITFKFKKRKNNERFAFSLLPYGEFSFLPNVGRDANGGIGATTFSAKASYKANVYDYHGGVHLRFHIPEKHLYPYLAFGVGGLRVNDGTISTLSYTDANGVHNLTGLSLVVPAGSNVAVNYGGGIRIYKNPNWGVRFEIKGYKPFNGQTLNAFGQSVTFNNSFAKFEFGVFRQFH